MTIIAHAVDFDGLPYLVALLVIMGLASLIGGMKTIGHLVDKNWKRAGNCALKTIGIVLALYVAPILIILTVGYILKFAHFIGEIIARW